MPDQSEPLTGPDLIDQLTSHNSASLRLAAGGEVESEGRQSDYDEGPLSTRNPGSLMPFLQWNSWGSIASSTKQQFDNFHPVDGGSDQQAQKPLVFAEGGEVDEHGPNDADHSLVSGNRSGTILNFLQWKSWGSIISSTIKQVEQAGGPAAVAAIAGAATGGVGAAAAAAVSTLTSSVGDMIAQFTAPAQQPQGNSLPQATALPMVMPMDNDVFSTLASGPSIDRTMSINVFKSGKEAGEPALPDRMHQLAAQFLAHVP